MEIMDEIDWTGMWRKSLEESSWGQRAGKPEYWDARVDQFEGVIKQSNREAMIMSRLEIEPDYTVLDIGAGPGTVAIPLAKIVKGVTAVEPSEGMLARLKENASKEHLANVTYINKKWEDVGIGEDMEEREHDIVIASYSLVMKDIKTTLLKMNDAAKRSVYIFAGAGREKAGSSFWATFHKGKPSPDYIFLYNILYQLGIYANVEIMNSNYDMQFRDLDAAVQHYIQHFKGWMDISSGDNEEKLRAYLSDNLVEEEGMLALKQKLKTAMIWWRKENENSEANGDDKK
ncbi:MAG: class I SAM-dependent methyltransferase [Methanophagales archaeon]|nr:class I SAM-dependent methyltransferase [Methanophagales archaeon]